MSRPLRANGRSGLRRILESGFLLPLGVLTLWWAGARAEWWSPFLLPAPDVVLRSFGDLVASGELQRNILASVGRILKGFSLSAAIAFSLAFLCGVYRPLLRQITPFLEFMRHIPPMATIPMLILWFGIGEASKLAIIFMATFFPIFLNTLQGMRNSDRGLVEVAYVFDYTRAEALRYVVLPAAIPYIVTGVKLGLGYSWRSLIAAELVAASSGLGYMILNAEQLSRPEVILVGILVIGFLGSGMDLLFSLASGWVGRNYRSSVDVVV